MALSKEDQEMRERMLQLAGHHNPNEVIPRAAKYVKFVKGEDEEGNK